MDQMKLGGLWPLPKGREGACRTVGGNEGFFDVLWSVSEAACQAACASSIDCMAFEFMSVQGYTACELHVTPVRHVLPMPGSVCRIKPVSTRHLPTLAVILDT